METTSLQIELVYSFSKFSSMGNVYFFFHTDVFIDVSLMSLICKVSKFGQYLASIVNTWSIQRPLNVGGILVDCQWYKIQCALGSF